MRLKTLIVIGATFFVCLAAMAGTTVFNPPDLQTVTSVGASTDDEVTINSNLIVNGRVGVNTNVPTEVVDIVGDVRICNDPSNARLTIETLGAAGNAQLFLISSNARSGQIAFNRTVPLVQTRGLIRYFHLIDQMEFQTQGTNRIVIDENGFVGIGTTNPPALLSLAGGNFDMGGGSITNVSTNSIAFNDGSRLTTDGSDIFYIRSDGTTNIVTASTNGFIQSILEDAAPKLSANLDLNGQQITDASGRLNLDDTLFVTNNRVGIGTNSPTAPLEIVGDSPGIVGGFFSGTVHIRSPLTNVNANTVLTGHSSFGGNKQLWYLGSTSSSSDDIAFINRQTGSLSLHAGNAQRLRILTDGNVGIGTNNPAELLSLGGGNLDMGGGNITNVAPGSIHFTTGDTLGVTNGTLQVNGVDVVSTSIVETAQFVSGGSTNFGTATNWTFIIGGTNTLFLTPNN